jgi:hypothetical protein
MLYRFIRTGYQPVNQTDNEDVIRDCFAFCPEEVRAKLERFFVSPQIAIEFEFDHPAHTVRLERVQ